MLQNLWKNKRSNERNQNDEMKMKNVDVHDLWSFNKLKYINM